ncbi:MAG: hypothetical protein LC649_02910 [Bacteroidales bacterium]|nr:hypothetical protein [Bacteroidales bacterium]
MKAITTLILMLTVLVFNVNGQGTDIKGLLDNHETRTDIFNAIASDNQLMMDFMKVARENEHGAMMLRSNENRQMEKMDSKEVAMTGMDKEQQMKEMMKNPEMREKMMGDMMEMCEKDSVMRKKMANMITEHPEMMKMCMQTLKEKGEMPDDEKMVKKEEKSKY